MRALECTSQSEDPSLSKKKKKQQRLVKLHQHTPLSLRKLTVPLTSFVIFFVKEYIVHLIRMCLHVHEIVCEYAKKRIT